MDFSAFRPVGNFMVAGWSISGFETCVVVKRDGFRICFDIGFSIDEAVQCDIVFISHAHIDHIGGLPQHARKRQLMRLPPAKYYMPADVVEPMRNICKLYSQLHGEGAESLDCLEFVPIVAGQRIQLSKGRSVEAFPTVHRVTSLGYIVRRRQMKRCLSGYGPNDSSSSSSSTSTGAPYTGEEVLLPEVAYLGDTAFSVFQQPPVDDLLRVELLITEATYLDRPDDRPSNPGLITRAREYGHTHLAEICHHAELFQGVGRILLIHFSKRYNTDYIWKLLRQQLPRSLQGRVLPATMANDCIESYCRK